MSIVEKAIRLYAWKPNYQAFRVVEGEADSRIFKVQLFSDLVPVNLAGCSVMLYVEKPDSTKVYVECEIIDTENGIVTVTLTEQVTAVDGDAGCWIQVVGRGGTDLRFEGMNIIISNCTLSRAVTSSNDFAAMRQFMSAHKVLESEVYGARMGKTSLGEKEADQDEQIEIQASRINNLAKVPAGGTSGDLELADMRMDFKGNVHENAGEAQRSQFRNMDARVAANEEITSMMKPETEDARKGADDVVYPTVGDAIRTQFRNLTQVTESSFNAATDRLNYHEKRLRNVEKLVNYQMFRGDVNASYHTTVPEDALPSAMICKVGGMTKKRVNLITKTSSSTVSGITATVANNGTVTFSGTTTAGYTYYLYNNRLPAGSYHMSWNSSLVGAFRYVYDAAASKVILVGDGQFTLQTESDIVIYVSQPDAGKAISGGILPMLNEGATALPYEPYFEGLHSAPVTEVESVGVNLFDENQITYATNSAGMASEAYGVVQDGVLIAKIGYHNYGITWNPFAMRLEPGTYMLSADCYISTGGAPNLRVVARLYNVKTQTHTSELIISLSAFDKWERISAQITVTEPSDYMLCVQGVGNADLSSNMDVRLKNICVAKGNIAEYSPYKKNVFQIPIAVQTLDGYGEGLDSNNFNSVEWSEDGKRVFNRRVKTIALDGSEEWYIAGGTFWTHINDSKKSQGAVLSSRYTCNIIDVLYVSVASTGVSTVDELKAALNADPLYVTYIIDTPETVDVSELLTEDNFIEVEGNGTLTFKNEFRHGVPSEVYYAFKED